MLYLDSSALIKHYQKEEGSEALEQKLQTERENSRTIFTSVLTYAEIHAIIARREREKLLSVNEANELHDHFDVDWTFELSPVELAVGVLVFLRTIVKAHPLRGTDAVQLGSALWLRDAARLGAGPGKYNERVEFSSSDRQLCIAAQKFNLQIFNPLDAS
jgi:predicted nucleic acid-binding protein